MEEKMYINRNSSSLLKRYSRQYPIVTITGPRQSGKTTLCRHIFSDMKYISLEDWDNRKYAQKDPRGFLSDYSGGVIIDEIQRVPKLLSYIQSHVDKSGIKGEFILTGSSQLELTKSISQSLAGRTALLKLFPFSYLEIHSPKESPVNLDEILYKGFYPRIHADKLDATDTLSDYTSTYIERDVGQFYNIKDLNLFQRFLQLCASRVGQLLNYSNIAGDCGVSVTTIQNWVSVLEQSFIIYRLYPFHANIRKRLVKTPKLYFYDTGLCAFLNGAKKIEHIKSLPTFGNIFENFVISEFIKTDYHNNLRNSFYFYRDKSGKEIDLILSDGLKKIPIEIKSAQTFSDEFTHNLKYYSHVTKVKDSGAVIYSGESQNRSDFRIYNYADAFRKFKKMEL